MNKKTVVLGASPDPGRYSNKAVLRLQSAGHEVIALGKEAGKIGEVNIQTYYPENIKELDTVSLYLNPLRQKGYYDYIIGLHPKRIIFNPGTENKELQVLAERNGISTEEACTLVLLGIGNY